MPLRRSLVQRSPKPGLNTVPLPRTRNTRAGERSASGFGAEAVAQLSLLPKGICQARSITYGTVAMAMAVRAAKSLSFCEGETRAGLGVGGWAERLEAMMLTIIAAENAHFIAK